MQGDLPSAEQQSCRRQGSDVGNHDFRFGGGSPNRAVRRTAAELCGFVTGHERIEHSPRGLLARAPTVSVRSTKAPEDEFFFALENGTIFRSAGLVFAGFRAVGSQRPWQGSFSCDAGS
jgi:hypothetical protein